MPHITKIYAGVGVFPMAPHAARAGRVRQQINFGPVAQRIELVCGSTVHGLSMRLAVLAAFMHERLNPQGVDGGSTPLRSINFGAAHFHAEKSRGRCLHPASGPEHSPRKAWKV